MTCMGITLPTTQYLGSQVPVAIAHLACLPLSLHSMAQRTLHRCTQEYGGPPPSPAKGCRRAGRATGHSFCSTVAEFDAESVRTHRQAPRRCAFGPLSPGEVFTGAWGLDLHLQPQAVVTKEPAHLQKWLRQSAVVTPSATAPTTSSWAEKRSHRRAQPPPAKPALPQGRRLGTHRTPSQVPALPASRSPQVEQAPKDF